MKLRYYLYPPAYTGTNSNAIENNLQDLNKVLTIHSDRYDTLCYDNSLFEISTATGATFMDVIYRGLPDVQFSRTVLPQMLNKLTILGHSLTDKACMDATFPDSQNALWGILFSEEQPYNITNVDKYLAFRSITVRKILNESNFRELKDLILKKLVFTDDVIKQITKVGNKIFTQIIDRLQELDRYNVEWQQGAFSIKTVNEQTSLNISDESDRIKNNEKLRMERYFILPNIGGQYCYLHIKTGDFRFHFYPNEKEHRIYIAYVGPHLPL